MLRRPVEPAAPKRTFANASGFIGSRPSDIRFGSGVFAPPIGPPDPVRCTSGPHDGPLIGGTESPIEASQRGLDQPRLEGNLCRLAVGIEFPGHSQRLQRRCDAAGLHDSLTMALIREPPNITVAFFAVF